MTDPSYHEYGLIAWLRRERTLSYTGYSQIGANPQVVHLLVIRWLLAWQKYATYTENRRAHEFTHCDMKSASHYPLAGDIMSERAWGATTDAWNAMSRSAAWREKIRSLRDYEAKP